MYETNARQKNGEYGVGYWPIYITYFCWNIIGISQHFACDKAAKNRLSVSLEYKKLGYKGIQNEFCIFTKIGSYLEHFYVIRPPILPRITQWCPISEA